MKLRRRKKKGFSLLEVIAAVVILAVVATATVGAIAPLRQKAQDKLNQQNIAKLNASVQAYFMEYGRWPDTNLNLLVARGYADRRNLTSPAGVRYVFNATTKKVTEGAGS